jgi:putative endonuclease
MANDLRRTLGQLGERHALDHLERLGLIAVARNHRTRWGEIDLIVCDGETIVFVEVKTRRAGGRSPFESLGPAKRRQVRRMAAAWLAEERSRPRARDLRFDAVGVTIDARGRLVALEHLEAAF